MLRKIEIEEEEEMFIYDADFLYDPEEDIDKVLLSDLNEEEDELYPIYESDPIYDTDGEEERAEEDDFLDEIEEQVTLVGENEIIAKVAERRSFFGKEEDFVGERKINEEVIFAESQRSSQEQRTMGTNDSRYKKNSDPLIFYDYCSKELQEIIIRSSMNKEGCFKSFMGVMRKCGGDLSLFDFKIIDYHMISGDLDLTCEVVGVFSFVVRKHQEGLFLDDGRILHPPNGYEKTVPKEMCVLGLNHQPQEASLYYNSCAMSLGGPREIVGMCWDKDGEACKFVQVHGLKNTLELRTIPFQGGGNDTNWKDSRSTNKGNGNLIVWNENMGEDDKYLGCNNSWMMTWRLCMQTWYHFKNKQVRAVNGRMENLGDLDGMEMSHDKWAWCMDAWFMSFKTFLVVIWPILLGLSVS